MLLYLEKCRFREEGLRYITIQGQANLQDLKKQARNALVARSVTRRNSKAVSQISRFIPRRRLDSPQVPCITTGSKYRTAEEIRRDEAKQSRTKWVSKRNFMASVGKSLVSSIPNYVSRLGGQNPNHHRFREETKAKWVGKEFFRY